MQNQSHQFDSSILNPKELIIADQILSMVESKSFDMQTFISIIIILSDTFLHDDFLGYDKEKLLDPDNINVYKDSEKGKELISLNSCRKAVEIVDGMFENGKFKFLWNSIISQRLTSCIGKFCSTLHNTDFSKVKDIKEFMSSVEQILLRALLVDDFDINTPEGILNIDLSIINKLGLMVMLKEDKYICLNEDFRAIVFNIKGIRTFIRELQRVLEYTLKNKLNINYTVDSSFEKNGMLYNMMRLDISEIERNFNKNDPDDVNRTYEETMETLSSKKLLKGLCPAAITEEESGLPIAHMFANAIVSAIPKHLIES